MNNTTKIALAGLLSATSTLINALAAELSGQPAPESAAAPETPKPKKQKASPAAEKPAEQPAPAETAAEPAETTNGGKTYEELRALIEPLVKGGQGAEVKKVIAEYGENLKDISTKPEKHAAFEKDILALSY